MFLLISGFTLINTNSFPLFQMEGVYNLNNYNFCRRSLRFFLNNNFNEEEYEELDECDNLPLNYYFELNNTNCNNKKIMIGFLHNKYPELYKCYPDFTNITTFFEEDSVLHNDLNCKITTYILIPDEDNLENANNKLELMNNNNSRHYLNWNEYNNWNLHKIPKSKINEIIKILPKKIKEYNSFCMNLNEEKINELYMEISKYLNILLCYGYNNYKDYFNKYGFLFLPTVISSYFNKIDNYQTAKNKILEIQTIGEYDPIYSLCKLLEESFNNKDYNYLIETMIINNNDTIKNIFLFVNNKFNGSLFIRNILFFAIKNNYLNLLCKIVESCGSKVLFIANSNGIILYDYLIYYNTINTYSQILSCNHILKTDKFYKGTISHSAIRQKCMPCVLNSLKNASLFNSLSRFGNTPFNLLSKFFNDDQKKVIFSKYLSDNINTYGFHNSEFLLYKLNYEIGNFEKIEDVRLVDALLSYAIKMEDPNLARRVINKYKGFDNILLKVINPKIRFFIEEQDRYEDLEQNTRFVSKRNRLLALLLGPNIKYHNSILIEAKNKACNSTLKKMIENKIINKK